MKKHTTFHDGNTKKKVCLIGFMLVLGRLDLHKVNVFAERYWKMMKRINRFV